MTTVLKTKRVLVIGGGTAGCEAAVAAAQKGDIVTLMEQSDHLGKQGDEDKLKKHYVQLLLNTRADAELIRLYEPETVIVATGANTDSAFWDALKDLACEVIQAGTVSEAKRGSPENRNEIRKNTEAVL